MPDDSDDDENDDPFDELHDLGGGMRYPEIVAHTLCCFASLHSSVFEVH